MRPAGERKRAYVEKMGTVTINMEEYEKAGTEMEVLRMVINAIEDLPLLPFVAHKILSLTQDEHTKTDELARVISNDQALSAKVLRIVNSPLYHLSSVVTSIPHAVMLLGFRGIRDMALGLSMIEMFNDSRGNGFLPRQRFWEHSLGCAFCCKALADRIRSSSPEEAFAGGLLHDIGRMVLNESFPGSFSEALRGVHIKRRPLFDLEREEVGIPHTVVGKLLLQKWNLPPSIAESVKSHHNPSLTDEASLSRLDIPSIIRVSDILTRTASIGFGGERHIHAIDADLMRRLPLQEEDYVAIVSDVATQVQEARGLFGIEDKGPSSEQLTPEGGNGERLRVAFCSDTGLGTFHPARVMLRRFSMLESFFVNSDIRTSIEETKPDLVSVDLSSEQDTNRIYEILRAYRSATASPMIFLLSREVSNETRQKSAKVGIFFISAPFSPQTLLDRLGEIGPLSSHHNKGSRP